MSSTEALLKRVDTMIEQVERHQAALTWEMEQRIHAWIREGLYRKLALLTGNSTGLRALATGQGLPDDFSEQCQAIDQDQDRRLSPAEREALATFHLKYAGDSAGAREQVLARLARLAESEGL